MSVHRVGFHYLTEDPAKTVQTLLRSEKNALSDPARPPAREYLNSNFPKGAMLGDAHAVSASPYVPDGGVSEHLCCLPLNTERSRYAQKLGKPRGHGSWMR